MLLPLPRPTFLVVYGLREVSLLSKTRPRSPFPDPRSRHTLGWTLDRHKLADSPKPQRVYYLNKRESRQRMVLKMQAHMLEDQECVSGGGWKRASVI